MADLGLPDAVDTTEALLDPVRVPGQVVVDEQTGALQIDALAGGVGSDEPVHVGLLRERLLGLAAQLALHPAVDPHNRLGAAEQGSNTVGR